MAKKAKKAKATKPRNRAAQDATLINISSLKRRVSMLEAGRKSDVDRLDGQERAIASVQKAALDLIVSVSVLEVQMNALLKRFDALESDVLATKEPKL